jgi:DNA-binding YbaB/EbfC family protein
LIDYCEATKGAIMPGFQDVKKMWELQKKAKQMQKELKETEIEARSADGKIGVVFNGEMHMKEITIDASLLAPANKNTLEAQLKTVISEALSRTQALSAEKAKEMMGDMGLKLPGM